MSTEGSIPYYSGGIGSASGSASEFPKDKVKILCSHGGKILPRPVDGHLKYVGGETRIISIPRDIKFRDLTKKLTNLIEGQMVLKYQLVPEDLDALVSVKSDEDLRHMFDEYDRNEIAGVPRLRTFLFPARPVLLENHMENQALEQRYIDAVNGYIRASQGGAKQRPVLNMSRSSFAMSPSDCSSPSPGSPENNYPENNTAHEPTTTPNNYHNHRNHMHRVQSSPSVYNLNGNYQTSPSHQPYSHNSYQSSRQQHQYHGHHSKPPFDPYKSVGPQRLISVRSVGRVEGLRYQVEQAPPQHYTCTKHSRGSGSQTGSGSCTRCMHHDEYSSWSDRRTEKGCSLPPSPLSLSPRAHSYIGMKPWDTAITEDN